MSRDPLALDRETMRRMGHEVVDLLVDRIANLANEPVLRTATRSEMEARLAGPAPARGGDFGAILRRLDADVLPFGAHSIHPEYLAERVGGRGEVDFADRGLQLTRTSRAIKIWLALQVFGVDAYREAIDRPMDLALGAQARIEGRGRDGRAVGGPCPGGGVSGPGRRRGT